MGARRSGGALQLAPVRADDRQGLGPAEQVGREVVDLVEGDRVEPGEHLVEGEQPVLEELDLAEPGHPRGGVLEAEHEAAAHLATAAVELFVRHRGGPRAFLVDAHRTPELEGASTAFTHRLAQTVTGWLRERFGCDAASAEAAWRLLFALGAARALFDDEAVSPTYLPPQDLAASLARAVLAVVTWPR